MSIFWPTPYYDRLTDTPFKLIALYCLIIWGQFQFDDMPNGENSASSLIRRQYLFLKDIQAMVRQMMEYLFDKSEEDNFRKEWQRATQRLDLLLMVVFLILNCIVTIGLIVIGYSNLEI